MAARPPSPRMACHATPASNATASVLETLLHRGRHTTRQVSSSDTCPCASGEPTRDIQVLRGLAKRDHIGWSLIESPTCNFQAMLNAGEDSCIAGKRTTRMKAEHQLCTALCAGVLSQKKKAGLGLFRGCAISEPCCQLHTRGILGCDATHVQYDCAEAASLQDQIRRL